jgi:hypothetical protein
MNDKKMKDFFELMVKKKMMMMDGAGAKIFVPYIFLSSDV